MPYCKYCGKELNSNANFCNGCGRAVEKPAPAPAPLKKSGKKTGLLWGIIGGSAAVIITAVLLVVFLVVLPGAKKPADKHYGTSQTPVYTDADDLLKQAAVLMDGGEYEEAILLYEEYVSIEPESALGYMGLADAYMELEQYDSAIESLNIGKRATEGEDNERVIRYLSEAGFRKEEAQPLSIEAQEFSDSVYAINDTHAYGSIDIFSGSYPSGDRTPYLQWDKSLFSLFGGMDANNELTGAISYYNVERKQLLNEATGNRMEYEIYRHPSTQIVSKIVSIEYMDGFLEITDYYYEDDGSVNFVFVHWDSVYTPDFARLSTPGERYYFTNDVMVRWRIVDQNTHRTDYILTENELIRGQTEVYTMYADMSPSLMADYDAMETKMLTAAYNTYNIVLSSEGVSSIMGSVKDADGASVPGATIKLYSADCQGWVYECLSDPEGAYNILVPSREDSYKLRIIADDCASVEVLGVDVSNQVIDTYVEPVCMVKEKSEPIDVRLLVIDAFNTSTVSYVDDYAEGLSRLEGAEINIRAGIGNRTGDIIRTVYSDSEGWVTLRLLPGCYTAEVIAEGYATTYITVVVRKADEVVQLTASPVLAGGEVRIVLTWGATPPDLDSHLFTPNGGSSDDTFHVWYGNMSDMMGNNLDVDDTTSFGPETMTINSLASGLYKYFVADYTNCNSNNPTAFEMSLSGAKVSVYTENGLSGAFYVPSNVSGVIWEVFQIRDMKIIPIERYYNNISDKSWWHQDK